MFEGWGTGRERGGEAKPAPNPIWTFLKFCLSGALPNCGGCTVWTDSIRGGGGRGRPEGANQTREGTTGGCSQPLSIPNPST